MTEEQNDALKLTIPEHCEGPLEIFSILAHHPRILKRFNVLAGGFQKGVLSPDIRELVILRVSFLCNAEYIFAEHIPVALAYGISEKQVEFIRRDEFSQQFSKEQKSVIEFVDHLIYHDSMTDDIWEAIPFKSHHPSMIEFVLLIGFYRMASVFINVTRVAD